MALPVRINRGRVADPFDIVRNDFDTMLSHLFGRASGGDRDSGGDLLAPLANYGVDIREDGDHVYVVADLPGFRKEDVDISMENGTLTITAERREEIAVPADGQRGRQGPADQSGQQAPPSQQQQQQQQQPAATDRQGQGEGPSGEYLLRERRVQRFVRSFTLPPNVDDRHVQARLENGVLTITLNKREESKPRRVQVS